MSRMQEVLIRIGETVIAFDAATMLVRSSNDRRFTITDSAGAFVCSLEVWGPHEVELIGDGTLSSVNSPDATQKEDCATAQPAGE